MEKSTGNWGIAVEEGGEKGKAIERANNVRGRGRRRKGKR